MAALLELRSASGPAPTTSGRRAALPPGEARHLVAAEIMGAIYFAILQRIERRGFDVFSEVVRVPRPQRAIIAATTWARTLMRAGVEAVVTRPARS